MKKRLTLKDIFGKPDFINECGTKFWRQNDIEKYAKLRIGDLPGLEHITCFSVETKDCKMAEYLLLKKNKPIYSSTAREAIICYIDQLKLLKKFDKKR